jgi:Na+-transporting NADH:ubiquinone oxidoreductase subunit NqrC
MLFFNSLEVVSDDATLKKIIRGVLLFSVCWSIIYEFLLLCTNLDRVNSIVYYELRNLLQFWL